MPGEYPPYAIAYIDRVPDDGEVLRHLEEHLKATIKLVVGLSEGQLLFRYAGGKWSVKEVLVQITDAERIFAYRALRIARKDKTELAGFEENDYVSASYADEREFKNILDELEVVRHSTIKLLANLRADVFSFTGLANGNPVSVHALAYMIMGHSNHHLEIIKDRYIDAK